LFYKKVVDLMLSSMKVRVCHFEKLFIKKLYLRLRSVKYARSSLVTSLFLPKEVSIVITPVNGCTPARATLLRHKMCGPFF